MTKEEIIENMVSEMPFRISKHTHSYISEAMSFYADQCVKEASESKWIKVEDGLPEEGKKVLCFGEAAGASPSMGGAYCFISYRVVKKHRQRGDRYIDENGFVASYVTHYQPLPLPPQI